MKLLLLSSINGEGHNSASRAIIEEAEARGHFGVMIDTLLFSSPRNSQRVKDIYVRSALHAPRLVGVGNELAERMSRLKAPSITYFANTRYSDRVGKFIADNRFDAVIATHIFGAQSLTYLHDRGAPFKSYFVVTDYTYTPFTNDTRLDGYFLPHADLVPRFEEEAPGHIYLPTGIPVGAAKLEHTPAQEARKQLGLPQGVPIVLLMTGSMGFGDMEPLVDALMHLAPEGTLLLVLCGNNGELRENLTRDWGGRGVRALGYTDKVGLYMDAADVLVTKPGGLSTTEAAVKEIPIVHTAPIPGWEEDNVAFFASRALSRTGKTPQEIARAAVALLNDPEARREMRRRQGEEINKYAARDIVDYVLRHGRD